MTPSFATAGAVLNCVVVNAAVTATLTTTQFNTAPAVANDGVMHVGEQE